MSAAFVPDTPDDLLAPRKGSMTARALVSFAQRSLFEARGELLVPALADTTEREAIAEWLEIVAGMLPGNPHAVARSLRDPALYIPARRLLGGEGDPQQAARAFVGSALLWLELEGVLPRAVALPFATHAIASGHGMRAHTSSFGKQGAREPLFAVEGRLLALSSGPWLEETTTLDAERIRGLREALAYIARFAPAERDDLDRMVAGFVVGARPESRRPLGVVFVDAQGSLLADVRAISDAVVREKLALLALAGEIAAPEGPLRAICSALALLRIRKAASAMSGAPMPSPSETHALLEAFETWRASAEIGALGRGVVTELERTLRG